MTFSPARLAAKLTRRAERPAGRSAGLTRRAAVLLMVTGWWLVATAQSPQLLRHRLDSLNGLLRLAPSDVDLRLKKAAVNLQLGQWEYAADEYGRVLAQDDKNPAALYFRAYAYTQLQQYGLARYDYEQMLSRLPRHYEARLGLAVLLDRMGRDGDARDEFNRLVELHPDSAGAFAARAAFESAHGFLELALWDWDQAVTRRPERLEYLVSRVDVLLQMGRRRDARQQLEAIISRRLATRGELHDWLERCQHP